MKRTLFVGLGVFGLLVVGAVGLIGWIAWTHRLSRLISAFALRRRKNPSVQRIQIINSAA